MRQYLRIKGPTQTTAYWASIVFGIYGGYLIQQGQVPASWGLVSFVAYMWFVITITVGYHRLFAHRAFKCNYIWHLIFGFTGVVIFQGSPLSWAAVHHAHHKHADTPQDSHITDWRYWLGRQYGPILKTKRAYAHLMKDRMHIVLHEYGLLFPLALIAVLFVISPDLLLYGYLLPLGVFFLFSNIHQSFSHFNGKPRNQPWLEFVFPACGEWTHANHHENPRAWRFGTVDLGAVFISAIQNNERATN